MSNSPNNPKRGLIQVSHRYGVATRFKTGHSDNTRGRPPHIDINLTRTEFFVGTRHDVFRLLLGRRGRA
jgi:hypothetical protein